MEQTVLFFVSQIETFRLFELGILKWLLHSAIIIVLNIIHVINNLLPSLLAKSLDTKPNWL